MQDLDTRAKVPYAFQAHPMMVVRKQVPTMTEPHLITDVRVFGEYDEQVEIKTGFGTWVFRIDERVNFPRRPDGSLRTWSDRDNLPAPKDMAVGDRLPPINPDGTWAPAPPGDHLGAQQLWHRKACTVTSIQPSQYAGNTVIVNVSSTSIKSKRILSIWERPLPVDLTRDMAQVKLLKIKAQGKNKLDPFQKYYASGPYMQEGRNGWVMLAHHPTGRGRWPKNIDHPILIPAPVDLRLQRPPTTHVGWSQFEFRGADQWARHKSDPMWGSPALITTPVIAPETQEAISEAMRRYLA